MVRKRTSNRGLKIKRFTLSLETEDYERLRELAERHRPRLSLQYVVRYAIRLLLESADDPEFLLKLRSPFRGKETNG